MNSFYAAIVTSVGYVLAILLLTRWILRRVESVDSPLEGSVKLTSLQRVKMIIRKAAACSCLIVIGGMGACLFEDPSPRSTQAVEASAFFLVVTVAFIIFCSLVGGSMKSKTFFKYFS